MADRKRRFSKTEIKAGLLVLASALVLGLFIAGVAGLRPPRPVKVFFADFKDVKGLHKGASVLFGGLNAGRVLEVGFKPDDHSMLRVKFDVAEAVPVNAESKAKIAQTTLTSENHLEVTTGQEDAPLLESGTVLDAQEGGLFDVAQMVGDEVQTLLGDVRDLLGAKDRTDEETVTIADLLENLEVALDESTEAVRDVRGVVNDSRDEADRILQKVQEVEDVAYSLVRDLRGVVEENRPVVNEAVESARQAARSGQEAAERVAKATERLDGMADSLEEALGGLNSVSGNSAEFVEKTRPVLEEILLDVRETVWHLKDFARQIEEQPESVLRGATPQGRNP